MLCYCGVTQELSDILQNTLQGMVPTPVTRSAKSHPLFVRDLEWETKATIAFKSTRRRTPIQITCAISSSSPADSSQWYEFFFFFDMAIFFTTVVMKLFIFCFNFNRHLITAVSFT